MMKLRELYGETVKELSSRCESAQNAQNAQFEARQILEKAGISQMKLICEPQEDLPDETVFAVREMTKKRVFGYPLQYIVGEWDFFGCEFKVGEGVLIPRQDTEVLAQLAADFLNSRDSADRRVLDLCAGSGCIGISLAKECKAEAVCVEKSERAFSYLEENIKKNSAEAAVKALLGDIFTLDITALGSFDAVLSNPPYLTAKDMTELQREVTFEPAEALAGGEDGLDFYRFIIRVYPKILKTGGLIAVEIGADLCEEVCGIFRENGITPQALRDYSGLSRVVYGFK